MAADKLVAWTQWPAVVATWPNGDFSSATYDFSSSDPGRLIFKPSVSYGVIVYQS